MFPGTHRDNLPPHRHGNRRSMRHPRRLPGFSRTTQSDTYQGKKHLLWRRFSWRGWKRRFLPLATGRKVKFLSPSYRVCHSLLSGGCLKLKWSASPKVFQSGPSMGTTSSKSPTSWFSPATICPTHSLSRYSPGLEKTDRSRQDKALLIVSYSIFILFFVVLQRISQNIA